MKRILMRLIPLFILQIVFSFLYSLTVAGFPLIEKLFIDHFEMAAGGSDIDFYQMFALPLLFYVLLIVINALTQSGTRIMEWKIGSSFTREMNHRLFLSFLRNEKTRIRTESVELVNILKEDVEALEEDYVSAWLDFFINLLSLLLFSVTIILYLDWRVFLTVFIGSALICMIPKWFQNILAKKRKDSIVKQKGYLKVLLDLLEGRKQYGAMNEKGYMHRHDSALERAQKARFIFGKWRTVSDTAADVGTQMVRFATLLVCIFLLSSRQMALGGVFASVAFAGNFLAPIESMLSSLNAIFSVGESREVIDFHLASFDSIDSSLPLISDIQPDVDHNGIDTLIFDQVTAVRGNVTVGPFDACFKLRRHYLISGANGTGKSTMLSVLSGNLEYSGRIYLSSASNCRNIDLREYERYPFIQSVRVDEHVFSADLWDNLSYFGAFAVDRNGVNDFMAVLEDKTRKRLLECRDCTELSSGQKQIIAILRAINAKPTILILDESFASMDTFHRENIRAYLRSMPLTIFEVAHDLTPDEKFGIDEEFHLTGSLCREEEGTVRDVPSNLSDPEDKYDEEDEEDD